MTYCGAPLVALDGEVGFCASLPLASSTETIDAGAFGNIGVHAQMSQIWLRNEPPNAPMKKLSASVYWRASAHSGSEEPS